MRQTVLSQLVETKLGRSLEEQLVEARAAGADWRSIANAITALTGVSVSHESVRAWMESSQPEHATTAGAA
jgi:hypothetical protein